MRSKSILALAAGIVLAASAAQGAEKLVIAGRDGGYAEALSKGNYIVYKPILDSACITSHDSLALGGENRQWKILPRLFDTPSTTIFN